MNNEKCPNCGKSYYSTSAGYTTLAYYPPIWKDGININPDRNTTTCEATCQECNTKWTITS